MTNFFRSRAARELAEIVRQREGVKPRASDAQGEKARDTHSDDLEYFTLRSCKQAEMAVKASCPRARAAHLRLADLHGAKAREAMTAAMRSNATSNEVRATSLLRLEMDLDLNTLLGSEGAEKFRSLRLE